MEALKGFFSGDPLSKPGLFPLLCLQLGIIINSFLFFEINIIPFSSLFVTQEKNPMEIQLKQILLKKTISPNLHIFICTSFL